MEDSELKLTELQFAILDGMADLYEDVEQLYLYANRRFALEQELNIKFPHMLVEVRFPLRDVIDEVGNLLRDGYILAKYSNDEEAAPLQPLNFETLHHYWFGPTEKGTRAWKVSFPDESQQRNW